MSIIDATNIYLEAMDQIAETKRRFNAFVQTEDTQPNTDLQTLANMWANNQHADNEYYFHMTDQHVKIGVHIQEGTESKRKWLAYISASVKMRALLMQMNRLLSKSCRQPSIRGRIA